MRGRTILVADLVTVGLAVGSVAHVDGADDLVRTHLLGSSLALLESDRPLEGLTVLQRLDLGMASDDGIGTVLTKHSLVIALADLVPDFCRVSVGIGNPEGSGRGNGRQCIRRRPTPVNLRLYMPSFWSSFQDSPRYSIFSGAGGSPTGGRPTAGSPIAGRAGYSFGWEDDWISFGLAGIWTPLSTGPLIALSTSAFEISFLSIAVSMQAASASWSFILYSIAK